MLKAAVLQIKVRDKKQQNLEQAEKMIRQAAAEQADMVVLPEMFNCPYDSKFFSGFAEEAGLGETSQFLSRMAKELKLWVIGGSIPEKDGDAIFNSSFVFNDSGNFIAKHRKMHLYDVNLANGFTFMESEILKAGNQLTLFDSPWGKIGLLICYDIRFPEPARLLALQGAKLIIIPAAFNMTTGPAHWEPQMRIRALDNQVFIMASSPARNTEASYHAYGHSLVVSPWGEILGEAGHEEDILYVNISIEQVDKIREEFPLLKHRRTDVYEVITR